MIRKMYLRLLCYAYNIARLLIHSRKIHSYLVCFMKIIGVLLYFAMRPLNPLPHYLRK